jgi:hypothetical protein
MTAGTLGAYALLIDSKTAEDRLRLACRYAANLRSYRANFHELERYPNIQSQMTERAYEAEQGYRVLLDLGVRWMNELSDSGIFSSWLSRSPLKDRALSSTEFKRAAAGAKNFFSERLSSEDVSVFDEIVQCLEMHKVQMSSRASDDYAIDFHDAGGVPRQLTFHLQPRSGDAGRISPESFFSSTGALPLSQTSGIYDINDCHRSTTRRQTAPATSVSLYGTVLGALGTGRELMYRHAREIEELGPAHLRGAGPAAVVIGIVLIAAAILAAVAGVAIILACGGVNPPYTNTPLPEGVCNAGIWLVLGALALFGIGSFSGGGGSSSTVNVLGSGNQEQDLPINAPSGS